MNKHQDWLIDHLGFELGNGEYSETSKGIMRHLLEKLTESECNFKQSPVSAKKFIEDWNQDNLPPHGNEERFNEDNGL